MSLPRAVQQNYVGVFQILMTTFSLCLSEASEEDLEELLLAAACFTERERLVDISTARLLLRKEDWIGAVRVLKRLEATGSNDRPLVIIMLAGSLFRMNDFEWCVYADEILREHRHTPAVGMISQMLKLEQRYRRPVASAVDVYKSRIIERLRVSMLET